MWALSAVRSLFQPLGSALWGRRPETICGCAKIKLYFWMLKSDSDHFHVTKYYPSFGFPPPVENVKAVLSSQAVQRQVGSELHLEADPRPRSHKRRVSAEGREAMCPWTELRCDASCRHLRLGVVPGTRWLKPAAPPKRARLILWAILSVPPTPSLFAHTSTLNMEQF